LSQCTGATTGLGWEHLEMDASTLPVACFKSSLMPKNPSLPFKNEGSLETKSYYLAWPVVSFPRHWLFESSSVRKLLILSFEHWSLTLITEIELKDIILSISQIPGYQLANSLFPKNQIWVILFLALTNFLKSRFVIKTLIQFINRIRRNLLF